MTASEEALSDVSGAELTEARRLLVDLVSTPSPSGEELPPAFIAADEALVALELEMTVFNVEREEHASRIARKEIGQRLENVPLKIVSVEEIESEETEDGDEPADHDSPAEAGDSEEESTESDDEDLIPEFDELVEDG